MIDKVSMDNALKRASLLETCKILPALSHIQPANFVIVRCLKSEADPFMLAEVCSIHSEDSSLKVHWWAPTPLSRSKQHHFHLMAFAAEMDKTQIKNKAERSTFMAFEPQNSNHKKQHSSFWLQQIELRQSPSA